jgi:hypothetical protein
MDFWPNLTPFQFYWPISLIIWSKIQSKILVGLSSKSLGHLFFNFLLFLKIGEVIYLGKTHIVNGQRSNFRKLIPISNWNNYFC